MATVSTVNGITFEPHIAGQERVRIDGEHVGYIGGEKNAPLCLKVTPSASEVTQLAKAVMDRRGYIPNIVWPPKVSAEDALEYERKRR